MNAFLTGSRVYGNVKPNSDIDLVIQVDLDTYSKLHKLAKVKEGQAVRFGKLNLILCRNDTEFACWRYGTDKLSYQQPATFTSEEATEIFDSLRELVGIESNGPSGAL